MTVQSHRASTTFELAPNGQNSGYLWFLANFISGSSSWRIIDSWKSTTYRAPPLENTIGGRYKGDPIADAQWLTWNDVANGAGIVIEMKNPRSGYPAMQVVIQQCYSTSLGYISGHTYRDDHFVTPNFFYNGTCFRVGTQGDWDLDNTRPDFADTTKSSNSSKHSWWDGGAAVGVRAHCVTDDDWLVLLCQREDLKDFTNILWLGQYTPKSAAQESVANPCYGILCNTDGTFIRPAMPLGGSANYFLKNLAQASERFGCLDESGIWREWSYHCNPAMDEFLMAQTQPNEFDSVVGVDLFEIIVRGVTGIGPGPDNRIIGSLRGAYWGNGLGTGAKFDSGNYLCTGPGYNVVLEWDNGQAL